MQTVVCHAGEQTVELQNLEKVFRRTGSKLSDPGGSGPWMVGTSPVQVWDRGKRKRVYSRR